MRQLILCDFDGTISTRDMGYTLLRRFSSGDWENIDQEFRQGRIGSKEAYCRIAKILKGNEKEIIDFIGNHSGIDTHFASFYQYCKKAGIDIKIVSDGLDLYIRRILDIHYLSEIPFYANETRFLKKNRITLRFPYSNAECGLCGTCKKKLVQLQRKTYDSVFFIGNGLSDCCGAKEADFVFAKEALYAYCVDQEIPCHFFNDFGEILGDLRKEVHGIIFDLDGTLIEAYEAVYIGLTEALQHFGRKPFPYKDIGHYLKADLEATLAPFLSPEEVIEAVPIMRRKYEEVYLDKTHFLDGAREVLEELRSQGIMMGVASNKFGRFSRGILAHLGVAGLFESVVGAGDVARNKPFPDMIYTLLRAMRLTPEKVIFVGDTVTDIETGKQAGVDVYALTTGFHSRHELSQGRPKRILRNLKELVRAITPLSSPHLPVS